MPTKAKKSRKTAKTKKSRTTKARTTKKTTRAKTKPAAKAKRATKAKKTTKAKKVVKAKSTRKMVRRKTPSPPKSMLQNVPVCSDHWHSMHERDFVFLNSEDHEVTVKKWMDKEYPFENYYTVPARGIGGPGRTDARLKDLSEGTYTYEVDGCRDITGGVPKEVTIP